MKKPGVSPDWIHEVGDGRGVRRVTVNGIKIDEAIYADTHFGFVDAFVTPYVVDRDKSGDWLMKRRLFGHVVVEVIDTGERFESKPGDWLRRFIQLFLSGLGLTRVWT